MTRVGQSKKCGSSPSPCVIRHARGTTFCSSGSSSDAYGNPYWIPTSRRAAAPARIAPKAARGPPQCDLSDGRRGATDELGDVPRRHDHRVHATPLELDDLRARHLARLRDRELPDRHVGEELECLLQIVRREMKCLRVVQLEHALEHFLAGDAHDEI